MQFTFRAQNNVVQGQYTPFKSHPHTAEPGSNLICGPLIPTPHLLTLSCIPAPPYEAIQTVLRTLSHAANCMNGTCR